MKVYPKETSTERTFRISGGKFNGFKMTKKLVKTKQFDADGNEVNYYDGSAEWYSVQKIDSSGMPIGRKYFGNDFAKAKRYYESDLV